MTYLILLALETHYHRQRHLPGRLWKHIPHCWKDQWHLPRFQRPTEARWARICILGSHPQSYIGNIHYTYLLSVEVQFISLV